MAFVALRQVESMPVRATEACRRRLPENGMSGIEMTIAKKRLLDSKGWVGGDAGDFPGLSEEERRFVELKMSLAHGVKELRERLGLTQLALAEKLGSSQSRVAKMEAGDGSVSLDLTMRSVLSMGATTTEIAKWIRRAEGRRAA